MQTIEWASLQYSGITKIFLPPKVTKLSKSVFSDCYKLSEIQIPANSLLQTIGKKAFYLTYIKEIYFPSSLTELEEEWCSNTFNLTKFIISPSNKNFKFINNECLVG